MTTPPTENSRKKSPSPYEWIPFGLFAALAAVYFHVATPGTPLAKFSLFVGLGLVPGMLWRLAGKNSWKIHRVCFAVSLIVFVLENPKLRPDAETIHKMAANWPLVALGFAASFTQPLWGALRTHLLLADSGVRITQRQSLDLCLIGSFFNIFLPGATGGDAYRIYAVVKNFKGKLGSTIASISLDRFLGFPSLILVVVLGIFLDYEFSRSNRVLSKLIPFIGGAGVVCMVLVAYLAFAGKSRRTKNNTNAATARVSRDAPGWTRRLHHTLANNVKSRATLPLALLYGFLSHLACIASCLCFGIALGVEGVPALRYFLIVPMAMAINAIPGAPGGVGQGEIAMATLLDMASPGVGNAQIGVMIMLLFRLSNMAMGLAGGLLYATGKSGKTDLAEIEAVSAAAAEADADADGEADNGN